MRHDVRRNEVLGAVLQVHKIPKQIALLVLIEGADRHRGKVAVCGGALLLLSFLLALGQMLVLLGQICPVLKATCDDSNGPAALRLLHKVLESLEAKRAMVDSPPVKLDADPGKERPDPVCAVTQ